MLCDSHTKKVKKVHFTPRTKFRFYCGLTLNTANHKVKFRPTDPSLTKSILKEIPLMNKSSESIFFLKEKKKMWKWMIRLGPFRPMLFITLSPPFLPPFVFTTLHSLLLSVFCEFKWLGHNVRSPGRFRLRVIQQKNRLRCGFPL